jgi:hypothetical protein
MTVVNCNHDARTGFAGAHGVEELGGGGSSHRYGVNAPSSAQDALPILKYWFLVFEMRRAG